jgi:hypothetical protein
MAKLTGKAKEEFLARMKRRRRKAARANPKKKRPATKKKANKKAPARRRNQEGDTAAAAMDKYEEFHQRPAGKIIEYEQALRYPEHYAEMGKLKQLTFDLDSFNKNFPLADFKGSLAVCTPDGNNIYFIGGDQRIDLDALNIASDKDFIELGPCRKIIYDTQKGFHDFAQINYFHHFGEEDGITPLLCYDRMNHALFLMGGNYRVRPEGITN